MTDPMQYDGTHSDVDSNPIYHEGVPTSFDSATQFMLTTVDNPFNPFNEFESWFAFDTTNGYNTCGLIARVSTLQADSTMKEFQLEQIQVFELILDLFGTDLYKIVTNDEVSED